MEVSLPSGVQDHLERLANLQLYGTTPAEVAAYFIIRDLDEIRCREPSLGSPSFNLPSVKHLQLAAKVFEKGRGYPFYRGVLP